MLQPEIADEMMSVIAAADDVSLVLSTKGVFIVILCSGKTILSQCPRLGQ
jgi:hypothetical protein